MLRDGGYEGRGSDVTWDKFFGGLIIWTVITTLCLLVLHWGGVL